MKYLEESQFDLAHSYQQIVKNQKNTQNLFRQLENIYQKKYSPVGFCSSILHEIEKELNSSSKQIFQTQQKIIDANQHFQTVKTRWKEDAQKCKLKTSIDKTTNNLKRTRKRPYGFYSQDVKLSTIQAIQSGRDIHEVAEQSGISFKNIMRWKKEGYQRKTSKHPHNQNQLQNELSKWIRQLIDNQQSVSMSEFKQKALSLSSDQNFKASREWILKFLKKYKLKDKITFVKK